MSAPNNSAVSLYIIAPAQLMWGSSEEAEYVRFIIIIFNYYSRLELIVAKLHGERGFAIQEDNRVGLYREYNSECKV
jgi:hypothetical protein